VLAIALVAVPAYASVQNVKISGDIDNTWLVRDKQNLGAGTPSDDFYQNLMITQTRLRVDADLTDNVGATVGLINERVWNEASSSDQIDLNLAYVTLREMLYSPLTVIIGRQNFSFGNSFIIDSAGANNAATSGGLMDVAEDLTKATAQDAIRLKLDYNPLTIDLVASKIGSNNSLGSTPADDDVDLFGINANYNLGDSMETIIESYFWAKIDQSLKDTGSSANGIKADSVYVFGGRASTNPIKGLNVQGELAFQRGTETLTAGTDALQREAMAAQVIANYILPFESTAQWSPVVTGVYTFLSGDSNPAEPDTTGGKERTYTAWDPMFENQGGGTIYNTLFNLTNAHIVHLQGEVKAMEDVTVWTSWDGIWLDKKIKDTTTPDKGTSTNISLLQPDGTSISGGAGSLVMTSDKKLGDEVAIGAVYDYTEDVQIGARLDWFIPGSAFADANSDVAFQSLVNANVAF
jgi:predicted porin